jgi:hypothetical protein
MAAETCVRWQISRFKSLNRDAQAAQRLIVKFVQPASLSGSNWKKISGS